MDKNYFIQLTLNLYKLTLLFPKKDPLRYKMRELGIEISANSVLIFEKDFSAFEDLIPETKKQIEILDCFFEVAKSLDWVSSEKIFEIQKEYAKIKKEIREVLFEKEKQLNFNLKNGIKLEEKSENTVVENPVDNYFGKTEEKNKENSDLDSKLESRISSMNKDLIENRGFVKIGDSMALAEKTSVTFKNSFSPRKEKILEILKQKDKAQVGDFKEFFPQVSKRTLRRDFKSLMDEGLVERVGDKSETFYKIKQ